MKADIMFYILLGYLYIASTLFLLYYFLERMIEGDFWERYKHKTIINFVTFYM